MKNRFKVALKAFQSGDVLWGGFNDLLLMHKDLTPAAFNQGAQALSHTPAYVPKNLEAVDTGNKEGDTAIAQHTNGFGKAVEGLEVESGSVETL